VLIPPCLARRVHKALLALPVPMGLPALKALLATTALPVRKARQELTRLCPALRVRRVRPARLATTALPVRKAPLVPLAPMALKAPLVPQEQIPRFPAPLAPMALKALLVPRVRLALPVRPALIPLCPALPVPMALKARLVPLALTVPLALKVRLALPQCRLTLATTPPWVAMA
jgi:hypothetical protein